MKRLFSILFIFALISGVFFATNIFIFTPKKAEKKPEVKQSLYQEEKENKPIYAISSEKAIGIFVDSKNENIRYFNSENGDIIESDLDGRNKRIISINNDGIVDLAKWSLSGREAVYRSNREYYNYNLSSGSRIKLRSGIDMISWSSDGSKLLYKIFDPETKTRSVSIADPSGENEVFLAKTTFKDVSISAIPQTLTVSFWNSPTYLEETSLKTVSMYGGDAKEIFSSKRGADYKWSPDGKRAFVSFSKTSSGDSLGSGMVELGGSYTELNIPTLASKTVWSLDGKTLYYALPAIPSGARIPDDYESGKISTVDTFWRADTENAQNNRLVELFSINTSFDVSEMNVAPNNRSLFFINKKDGLVYRLDF